MFTDRLSFEYEDEIDSTEDIEGTNTSISSSLINENENIQKRTHRRSKLDIVPIEERIKIAQLIFKKQLTYKKAVEMILESYPQIDSLSLQNLKDHLIVRGFFPNEEMFVKKYKKLNERELIAKKREVIALYLLNDILNKEEHLDSLVNKLVNNKAFIKKIKEKLKDEQS